MVLEVITARFMYFWVSGFLFLFSLFAIFIFDINLWIDMTGGTQSEFRYSNTQIDIEEIQKLIETKKEEFNKDENKINTINCV